MRTTLTLDDALVRQLRQQAASRGQSFKQVVNDTLRAGLASAAQTPRRPYSCPSFSIGGVMPGIDLNTANQLAAGLEDAQVGPALTGGR